MKKTILTISAGFILWLFTLPAIAQRDIQPVPSWVSDRGYWVVQNNIHASGISVVYFYNNNSDLVYKEEIKGILNTNRKKTKLRLTKVLEQSVTAWEKYNIVPLDRQLLTKLPLVDKTSASIDK